MTGETIAIIAVIAVVLLIIVIASASRSKKTKGVSYTPATPVVPVRTSTSTGGTTSGGTTSGTSGKTTVSRPTDEPPVIITTLTSGKKPTPKPKPGGEQHTIYAFERYTRVRICPRCDGENSFGRSACCICGRSL